MKETGITRRVDELGRIAIPREIRRRLGITEGSPLEIFITDEGVLFKKFNLGISITERINELENELNEFSNDLWGEKATGIKNCLCEIKEIINNGI